VSDELRAALGQVIRAERTKRGLTQQQLAEKSGLHYTYVSMLERGQRNPSIEIVAALGQALGVEGSSLLRKAERKSKS
jgi:transcriptional regulator with XRE-family HTH domain